MAYTFDVLTQITDMQSLFSPVEQKVSSYVLAHAEDVVNQSISELAESIGVGVSTLSRFCRHLSLNGYQEFRLELARSLASRRDDSVKSSDISPEDTVSDMLTKMVSAYDNVFGKVVAGLDQGAFSRVSDMIEAAADVHFVGTGNMLPIALAAHLQFMEVSTKFHCVLDAASQALSTSMMTKDSLVIIYSYSGEVISAVDVARYAKSSGAKVVAVTRYSQSSLTELCDEVLICSVMHTKRMNSSLPLCSGFSFISDLLYTEYFRRNTKECAANREKAFNRVVGHL